MVLSAPSAEDESTEETRKLTTIFCEAFMSRAATAVFIATALFSSVSSEWRYLNRTTNASAESPSMPTNQFLVLAALSFAVKTPQAAISFIAAANFSLSRFIVSVTAGAVSSPF